MTQQELQDKIEYLIDVEKYNYFSLQDKNTNARPNGGNCVYFWMQDNKYVKNAEKIRRELVQRVFDVPKKYVLYYNRTTNDKNVEKYTIDTRINGSQLANNDNLEDMDDRNKEERRNDELYIRELCSKIGFLESEVIRLKDKNEELEQQLEDEMAGNSQAQMADATTSTIGQVAQIVPMLFDKYFAIQERKNELLAEQIRRQAPPAMRPQPTNQTFEQPANGFYYEGEN